jgi:epoxyqueuosine reductase
VDNSALTTALKRHARELGFALVGACPAVTPDGVSRFYQWLAAGYAGEMEYLPRRAAAYEHPKHVLPGVKSLLMLGLPYRTREPAPPGAGQGRISRYAWGPGDYHDVIHQRLKLLADYLLELVPGSTTRGVVDTAPLLEREFAQLAGLGWIGKNTLLLSKEHGSWFFLAALLTDVELEYDEPTRTDHCGTCRACLDACPTGAFVDAYVLDARRCLSYTTIEQRTMPDEDLRVAQGDWIFGCDVCQDVCPWNHRAPLSDEPAFAPTGDANPVDLAALFWLDDDAFRRRFRHTPLWRALGGGILRSAAFALANRPSAEAISALERGSRDHEEQVCQASQWALNRLRAN